MLCYISRIAYDLLKKCEKISDIVIFKGSKDVFCGGGDIKSMIYDPIEKTSLPYKFLIDSMDLISKYKKPYVAIVDGLSRGGASIYFMSAKYAVVTERTTFAMPETTIGYFNDGGSSFFLPRLRNNFGIYLGLTGVVLKGIDIKRVGLVSHFVDSSKLENLEHFLLTCKSDEDLKKVLDEFSTQPDDSKELDEVLQKTDKCFNGTSVEEIVENLKIDGSDWAEKTLKRLSRSSPTSLKVSLRCMLEGRKMTLRECLDRERELFIRHVINSDFKEGFRALKVDKDFKPKWNPSSLEEVTEQRVQWFFTPIAKI